MKVGIVVEGRSEFKGLPEIRDQLIELTDAAALKILFAPYDPKGSPGKIARECESRIKQLAGRGFNRVIVLVDREDRTDSCSEIADAIESAIADRKLGIQAHVVVKNRSFENWLVSDPTALTTMKARFALSKEMLRRIRPDKADRIDALSLLKKAAQGGAYGKVDDSRRILARADVSRMGSNSRSFRCLLGRLGHPDYRSGSCQPATS